MGIYIFRHGETEYKQGKVTLGNGRDLTPEGEKIVGDSANQLAEHITSTPAGYILPVKIQTSPMGRCVHTAESIFQTLEDRGLRTLPLEINEELEEVRNFDWSLFYPLVVGGRAFFEGEEFEVDKTLTNPQDLSVARYFRSNSAHNLSAAATAQLPDSYIRRLNSFERYEASVDRLHKEVLRLDASRGINHILVTHEGPTGNLIERATGNSEAYLVRGKYFEVAIEGNKVVPYLHSQDATTVDK